MRINKHIQIVRSSKPGLSSMGQKSCSMIKAVLEQHYSKVGITLINNTFDLEFLAAKKPDLVFLGVKKVPGSLLYSNSSAWVSEFLDSKGICYTGSASKAIALDYSKPEAKRVIGRAGLNTSRFFMAHKGQFLRSEELPLSFPLFIKPPFTGGGKGIDANSVVRDFNSFTARVDFIANKFQSEALIEEYLLGREFSVALLDGAGKGGLEAMPIELITARNYRGDRILGQSIKSADTERAVGLDSGQIKKDVIQLAVAAYKALGARDYGRIDIRLNKLGIPYFLEANLIPGLANHDFTSYFTNACQKNLGMDYESMILHITELGLSHANSAASHMIEEDEFSANLLPAFAKP